MLKRAISITQEHLKKVGLFAGPLDGVASPALDAAVLNGLAPRQAELSPGPKALTASRRLVMMFQLICKDKAIDGEPIDGFWGPVTQNAFDSLVHLLDQGTVAPNWRDDEPSEANPNAWPSDTGSQQDMVNFYGQAGAPAMKKVRCPWTLRLAWDLGTKVQNISCNAKVANSVESVLTKVHQHYGEPALQQLRLDLYGGCFAARKKRGGTTWSTHAWAVALDWDPDRNQLKWGRDKASLDASEYDFWWHAWEAEGWVSLGRSRNFDWMHIQAARL